MADAVSTPSGASVGDVSTPVDGSLDAASHKVCRKLLEDLAGDTVFAPYFEAPIDLVTYSDYRDYVDRPICYSDIRVRYGVGMWWRAVALIGGILPKIGHEVGC
jgi:hypothetical protein